MTIVQKLFECGCGLPKDSTTTNHEGLIILITCHTKQVNKKIRADLEVVRCPRKNDYYF
jgi:hypothetical protein